MIKLSSCLVSLLILLTGCNQPASQEQKTLSEPSITKSIQGQWIEADNAEYIQGFSLEENGLAREIGTHTLTYSAWNLSGNQLLLTGKSIGNGQTIDFIDTLEVIRMDSILVVNNSRGAQIRYMRPVKN